MENDDKPEGEKHDVAEHGKPKNLEQRRGPSGISIVLGVVIIVLVIVAFSTLVAKDRHTNFDVDVFADIDKNDLAEKDSEFKEQQTQNGGTLNTIFKGFRYLMTWKDKAEEDKAVTRIQTIEDKLFQINFKLLKTKSHCNVFKGVHVDHYPAVVKNIAKMLNLPKDKEKALLFAVNVKDEFEENFDSFSADNKNGEQLFGRFAVKKISSKWIAMIYTIKSIRFKLSNKEDQLNGGNITDLINFNKDGNVALTMKAEKFFAEYYVYEAQMHFNKKCKFLMPETSSTESGKPKEL